MVSLGTALNPGRGSGHKKNKINRNLRTHVEDKGQNEPAK